MRNRRSFFFGRKTPVRHPYLRAAFFAGTEDRVPVWEFMKKGKYGNDGTIEKYV